MKTLRTILEELVRKATVSNVRDILIDNAVKEIEEGYGKQMQSGSV